MEKFLQMPLKLQINIFIIVLYIITIFLIFAFSQSISSMHFKFVKEKKKEYFLSMERNIIESDIYFINMCLLQYENIIKFFNSEIYHYNNNETILQYFYYKANIPNQNNENKIKVFNNITELNDYPDYKESISDDESKIYIYCGAKNVSACKKISSLISAHSLSFLNEIKAVRDFKIPFYGDQQLMKEYIIFLKNYYTFFSTNSTKIKGVLKYFGSIDNFVKEFDYNITRDYFYHLQCFNEYNNNQIKLMDLMYNKTYFIFENSSLINNTFEKEKYVKQQSIYFQSINFTNDYTFFFSNWDINQSKIIGDNNIIPDYLTWILFNISKKLDIISLPIEYSTKKLISKKLCYYFILKQIYFLIIETDYSYDKDLLDEIYDKIINGDDISDINECKLNKYYEDISENLNVREELFKYYDLKNVFDSYAYRLIKNDLFSYVFEIKSTYPNLECLKLFYPNFFSFHQLDFYSYTIGANISRMIFESEEFVNNVNYLIIITLWFFWIIMTIIFSLILINVIPKITDPIVRLTQIINLSTNDLKKENLFEYKLDDDINNFFSLCKNLIEGEMINNDLNLNEILEDKTLDNSSNNNMIINNKMILELIEDQKNLNNNDKDIFILKEGKIKDKKDKIIKSPRKRNRKYNGLNNLDVIKLMSLNSGENSDINSNHSKNIKINNVDLYSKADEDDSEINDLKQYEDLIKITDYVFYGKEKEKINKMRKNIDKNSSISKKSKPENSFKIIKGFNNITFYWYIAEKNNRNIKRYSEIYS